MADSTSTDKPAPSKQAAKASEKGAAAKAAEAKGQKARPGWHNPAWPAWYAPPDRIAGVDTKNMAWDEYERRVRAFNEGSLTQNERSVPAALRDQSGPGGDYLPGFGPPGIAPGATVAGSGAKYTRPEPTLVTSGINEALAGAPQSPDTLPVAQQPIPGLGQANTPGPMGGASLDDALAVAPGIYDKPKPTGKSGRVGRIAPAPAAGATPASAGVYDDVAALRGEALPARTPAAGPASASSPGGPAGGVAAAADDAAAMAANAADDVAATGWRGKMQGALKGKGGLKGAGMRGLGAMMVAPMVTGGLEQALGGDGTTGGNIGEGIGVGGGLGYTIAGLPGAAIGAGLGAGLNALTGGGAADMIQNSPLGFVVGGQGNSAENDQFVKAGWASDSQDFSQRKAMMDTLLGMGFDQQIAMQQAFGDTRGGQQALGSMSSTGQMSPAQEAAMLAEFISPYTQQMRATNAAYTNAIQSIPNMPAGLASQVATWAPLQQALTDRQAANMEAFAALGPTMYGAQADAGFGGNLDALLGVPGA